MTEEPTIANSLLRDARTMLNRLLAMHVDRDVKEWDLADQLTDQIEAHLAEGEKPAPGDEGNHDCLAKRRPGEPMFIFLGRDPDGHNMARQWAERRLIAGGDPEHCQMGLDRAAEMEAYAADPANRPASAPPADAYPPLCAPTPPTAGALERVATAYYDGFCDGIMRQPWEAAADYAALMGQAYAKTGERPQPFIPVTGPDPEAGASCRCGALSDALSFYADPEKWIVGPKVEDDVQSSPIEDDAGDLAREALASRATTPGAWVPTHQHVKTGGLYRLVADAVMQCASPVADEAYLALYQGQNGKLWVRPADEFKDGRFIAVPKPT